MRDLRLAKGFGLPVEIAGEAVAILGKRGSGKSFTAAVLVEELYDHGVQFVILDPVGIWHGIRSPAKDEQTGGLPVPIVGGEHGDVPLEATAGSLIADVVVDSGESLVIDLSALPSQGAQTRFVTDFAERLYRHKAAKRSLLHVVLEESDVFAPQRPMRDEARMLGAIEVLVRRGRSRGIGMTMICQRSAALNKNVLEQADVLIVMRTTGPRDRKAIEAWIEKQDADRADEVLPSLPSLETGVAWFWNPERSILHKSKVRARRTFDSSATPKAGATRAEPKDRAVIDLTRLGQQIQATAERAKESDPKALRQRISELERELAARPTEVEERVVEVAVEKNVLTDEQLREIEALVGRLSPAFAELTEALSAVAQGPPPLAQAPPPKPREPVAPVRRPATRPTASLNGDEEPLARAERRILQALAPYPSRTKRQVALLTGYAMKGGGFANALGSLRSKRGFIEGRDQLSITAEGLAALGDDWEPLPMGGALFDYWLGQLGKAERAILTAVFESFPTALTKQEIADVTGYAVGGGGFANALGRLRTLQLIDGHQEICASEDFFVTS